MTLGRLTVVCFSPPSALWGFLRIFSSTSGSLAFKPVHFSFLFRAQILFNLNFIPFQTIKSAKVALKGTGFGVLEIGYLQCK